MAIAAVAGALALALIIGLVVSIYLYRSRTNATAITSIAVMPFVNDGGNTDLEYLSDGMSECE